MHSLREWQTLQKNPASLIIAGSSKDQSDKWLPFPIGLKATVDPNVFKNNQCGSHDKTVLCSIQTFTDKRRRNTNNRESFVKTLASNGIYNQEIPFEQYQQTLSEYKFIVSPEGNGIDCHRHYEALIAGSIPIVEDNPLIREKYKGCPILYTKDYSEIIVDYLEKVYSEMIDEKYDFSVLFLSYYNPLMQIEIKSNSRYWCELYGVPLWYPESINTIVKWLKFY